MSSTAEPHSSEAYTVAWIAGLPHERAAGMMMLDERYRQPPSDFCKNSSDPNTYTWGRISHHYVVIASLPAGEYGTTTTAITVQGLRSSLPRIRIGLLVGIGAGVPGEKPPADGTVAIQRDIRLGDVVVSNPDGANGGVVQYDFIKAKKLIELKGFLNSPPQALRNALAALQAEHELEDSKITEYVAESLRKHPKAATPYSRPAADTDRLFKSTYSHTGGDTCQSCSQAEQVGRPSREAPEIHYGTIASGNTLVKDAQYRDEIKYAALAAAAFAKEFLGIVDAAEVRRTPELWRVLENIDVKVDEVLATGRSTHVMIERSTADAQRDKTHQWLSPPDPSMNHNKALQQRHAGTGLWFVKHETFSSFKDGKVPILWLHGIPGCGKTVLSSTIIEDLRASSATSATALLLYFYFDFNDQQKQTCDGALRSLVCQMAHQSDSAFDQLDHLRRNGQSSIQELSQTLEKMLNGGDRVTIVLDALDECTTRDQLLKWIQRLMASEIASLKMVVTSRKVYDINLVFEKFVKEEATIPLQQHHVDVDIRAYVHARIRTDSDWERWRSKPQRPLEIEELVDFLAVDLHSEPGFDVENRMPVPREIVRLCSSLVTIVEIRHHMEERDSVWAETSSNSEEGKGKYEIGAQGEQTTREMRLAHFSVKEYLISERLDERYQVHLRGMPSAACIASALLTYLLNIGGDIDLAELETKFPLSHFSARYWTDFAVYAETSDESVPELAIRLLSDGRARARWLSLDDPSPPLRKGELPQPLYYAALCGLERSTSLLLDKGVDFDAQGGLPGNALQAACVGGHEKIAEMLLRNGADVDAQGGAYGNALQAACARGSEKIVEMLLSNGADVHAQGGAYGNALQAACTVGYEKIAEMLLSHGADVNARGGRFGSALSGACFYGHESVAEWLLDNGADVNAQSEEEFSNAVSVARDRGYEHIVEMLLARGSDPPAPSHRNRK
ncbi:hypothetical protein B0A54_10530 [Friedmanniomyces endolithicus]|uniref:NACHT domain-containing protein n=1 Tax=Friedmanniomyces endolithicus TaxID=329885 RepID=A0A4U0UPR2_9PEZI|nr:hypothetical protein B0A54_10530 [Friedmanniomyces endolithicus]